MIIANPVTDFPITTYIYGGIASCEHRAAISVKVTDALYLTMLETMHNILINN